MQQKITIGAEILGTDPRLVGFSEKYAFQDGKKGSQIGLSLEVILPSSGFDKLRVAISDMTLPITQEEVAARNVRFDPIKIQFEGFSASPYVDKAGKIAFSAKADKVVLVGVKKEAI